jgi:hypothetical protein
MFVHYLLTIICLCTTINVSACLDIGGIQRLSRSHVIDASIIDLRVCVLSSVSQE